MKDEVTNKNPFVISILYYKRDNIVLIESATLFLTARLSTESEMKMQMRNVAKVFSRRSKLRAPQLAV